MKSRDLPFRRSAIIIAAGALAFAPITARLSFAQFAIKNGDVDEDGTRNLTDAVLLLQFLFLQGQAPIAIVEKKGLPTTGQTRCYDDSGVIPCPSPGEPYYGQEANHPGFPHDYEVVRPDPDDPSTWYTIDYSTALLWQYKNDGRRRTWREAQECAASLCLGGYDGWRVPNLTELLSILDLTQEPPCFDTSAFDLAIEEPWYHTFWTSTTTLPDENGAFVVSFKYGTIHYSPKDPGFPTDFVRAVRSIDRAPANGDVNGDGEIDISDPIRLLLYLFGQGETPVPLKHVIGLPVTSHCEDVEPRPGWECREQGGSDAIGVPRDYEVVRPDPEDERTWYTIDHATGRMWQYAEELRQMTWREALEYCEALELGGFDDWRLPSVKELQSIANYGRWPLRFDPEYFGMRSYALEYRDHWQFWSATPGYIFYMDVGLIGMSEPIWPSWVRAVRTAE